MTAHALRQVLQRPADAGLYHVSASGETSWCGYANYVLAYAARVQAATANIAAKQGPVLKTRLATPIPTSAYPTPARRPLNSRLDTRKLQAAFSLSLPAWQCGVERMLKEVCGSQSGH